jgi:hypothetical protein
MTVFLVSEGYQETRLLDMDHVSFTALHDMVRRRKADDAALDMELQAVAAQGDGKGIRKTADNLRRSAGTLPDTKKDGLEGLKRRFGSM